MTNDEIDKLILKHKIMDQWPTQKDCHAFARALLTKSEAEIKALHAKLAAETLRADQGWQRYEAANAARLNSDAALAKAVPEGFVVVPKKATTMMKHAIFVNERDANRAWEEAVLAAPSPQGEKK